MSIQRSPKYVARDIAKQLSKKQPKRPKPPKEFPQSVKDRIHERAHGVCELDACGPIEVYHHRRPRGAGGSSLEWVNRAANGLGLSDLCHLRVEGRLTGSSRHRSLVNGWLVSMNGSEISADVHCLYRGRWVLLDDEGGVREIGGAA